MELSWELLVWIWFGGGGGGKLTIKKKKNFFYIFYCFLCILQQHNQLYITFLSIKKYFFDEFRVVGDMHLQGWCREINSFSATKIGSSQSRATAGLSQLPGIWFKVGKMSGILFKNRENHEFALKFNKTWKCFSTKFLTAPKYCMNFKRLIILNNITAYMNMEKKYIVMSILKNAWNFILC